MQLEQKKLKEHAVDHLEGGLYSQPSTDQKAVSAPCRDATNDLNKGSFGMLS